MVVSIHQPNFLPWIGYFNKILRSDIFIILDNVQFSKGSYTNRSKLKFSDGTARWLTVPIDFEGSNSQIINDLKISWKSPWKRKHLETFKSNYSRAPYYEEVYELIQKVYLQDHSNLCSFNSALIRTCLEYLNIQTRILLASDIQEQTQNIFMKNERLVDLISKVGGDVYLSGAGARSYNDEALFKSNGIFIKYNDFHPRPYPQLYKDFIGGLSTMDLLFNCGKESINYLKKE